MAGPLIARALAWLGIRMGAADAPEVVPARPQRMPIEATGILDQIEAETPRVPEFGPPPPYTITKQPGET